MCGMHGAHNVADHEPDYGTKRIAIGVTFNKPFVIAHSSSFIRTDVMPGPVCR
jgi:hypothetical protein